MFSPQIIKGGKNLIGSYFETIKVPTESGDIRFTTLGLGVGSRGQPLVTFGGQDTQPFQFVKYGTPKYFEKIPIESLTSNLPQPKSCYRWKSIT